MKYPVSLYPLSIGFFFSINLIAQSPAFSQFYALRNALNPAYVSTVSGAEFSAGHRRQWGQLQSGFQTSFASAAVRACQIPLAWGAYVQDVREPYFGYQQQEGGVQVGTFIGNKDQWSLHGGLQAGIGQHRVDYSKLLFAGQLDPVFGVQSGQPNIFQNSDGSHVETFELGGGLVFRSKLAVAKSEFPVSLGAVIHHLGGSRDVSFLRLPDGNQARRNTIHGSVAVPVTSGLQRRQVLYLNLIGRYEWESGLRRTTLGGIFQYDAAHLGLFVQTNRQPFSNGNTNAFSIALGADVRISEGWKCSLQYAFDGSMGGLGQSSTGGAHELVAFFTLPDACLFKGKSPRGRTDCFFFAGKGYRRFLN